MPFGHKEEAAASRDEATGSYTVVYKGGLRELPKAKHGKITLDILPDRFRLTAGNNVAQKFWADLDIPYAAVSAVEVTDRSVSTFESFAGGLNSRQLNQKNNIHFSYAGSDGPVVLRVEMLTGVTVMNQAKKCQEFEDLLRSHQIPARFGAAAPAQAPAPQALSAADELAKLATLRDQGILSEEEFQAQKLKILG
jgi:hypothetical protein